MRDHSWEESIEEINERAAKRGWTGRRPLLNPGSSYVNRDEEIRRMAEAYEERKHAVFLTPAQIKRLVTALVDTSGGVDVGDHALYVALINVYERAGGV